MPPPLKRFVRLIEENQKEGIVVAEIGIGKGDTTVAYLDIVKRNNGKVFAIDHFCGNMGARERDNYLWNFDNKEQAYKFFSQRIRPWSELVTVFWMDRLDALEYIRDGSIDICFIDADHRYSAVMKDIQGYLPKVKKGGLLCGHDCEDLNLDVSIIGKDFKEVLELDYVEGKHWGVIKAVVDNFGRDGVELLEDAIWMKRL